MNEHRKWGDRTWREMTVAQMVAEHDKTVQAWQDSQAELDRIGKINDSMCDTIAEMEKAKIDYCANNFIDDPEFNFMDAMRTRRRMGLADKDRKSMWPRIAILLDKIELLESRPVLTWEECEAKYMDLIDRAETDATSDYFDFRVWLQSRLPAPTDSIRVPFIDAQIEAMAKAAHDCRNFRDEQFPQPNWETLHDDLKAKWRAAIRAALTAGGLEPCAVPEWASDEELLDILTDAERDAEAIAAVRARVEAPLLAEIAEHRRHVGIVMSRESATRAELEAVKAGLIEAKRQRDVLASKLIAKNPSEPVYGGWHLEDGYKIVPNCELSGNTGELPAEPVSDTYKLGELLVIFQKAKAVNGWESDGLLAVMNHIKSLPQPTCHEPTGWELDVTWQEMLTLWSSNTSSKGGMEAILDLCRSRIRPTFECKRCAKLSELRKLVIEGAEEVRNRIKAARAALEGE